MIISFAKRLQKRFLSFWGVFSPQKIWFWGPKEEANFGGVSLSSLYNNKNVNDSRGFPSHLVFLRCIPWWETIK